MTLGMAIETTTVNYGVAVFSGREVHAHRTIRRDSPLFENIGSLAAAVLAEINRSFTDLSLLAVNIGPGNLTSVRAGVAYVNGLAFSLNCPVIAVDALALLAHQASPDNKETVLCLRNAGSGNAYAGLFGVGLPKIRHGSLMSVVTELARDLPALSVAGAFRTEAQELSSPAIVTDTGIEASSVMTLHDVVTRNPDSVAPTQFVSPLTELSPVFLNDRRSDRVEEALQ